MLSVANGCRTNCKHSIVPSYLHLQTIVFLQPRNKTKWDKDKEITPFGFLNFFPFFISPFCMKRLHALSSISPFYKEYFLNCMQVNWVDFSLRFTKENRGWTWTRQSQNETWITPLKRYWWGYHICAIKEVVLCHLGPQFWPRKSTFKHRFAGGAHKVLKLLNISTSSYDIIEEKKALSEWYQWVLRWNRPIHSRRGCKVLFSLT